ncbi:DUF1697 domain-containing protein [Cereibacter sphaeroides]|nr:DUF1697 domain-containing protein [Cereibacter sphaeroides]
MSAEPQILLLRGVNVGANRKLPMADLRALLGDLGLTGVATHIQSGNAVFRDPNARPDLASAISDAIGAAFPFRPEAMVLDLAGFAAVLAENPFAEAGEADGAKVHLGFLSGTATADLAKLDTLKAGAEAWHLTEKALYLHLPDGAGRSRLAAGAEKALGCPVTFRNRRVCAALLSLAKEA